MERLRCIKCGTVAACGCGAPYVSKVEYAAAHMNPKKSARQNAKELNVSVDTAAKALKRVSEKQTPEFKSKQSKGKKPKSKTTARPRGRPSKHPHANNDFTPQEKWENSLMTLAGFAVRMDEEWTKAFGDWRQFPMTSCTYDLICRARDAWVKLASEIKQQPEEQCNVVHYKQRSA